MENTAIVNYSALLARLDELKLEKEIQEMSLKFNFNEFISTIDLLSLFKPNTSNQGSTNDLTKIGLNMATNLIIGLVFGKSRSIKGYLSALMAQRFTTKIIDNNLIHVVTKIGSMIFRKRNRNNTNQQ